MKASLTLFVLMVLLLSVLAGCMPGANQLTGTAGERSGVAGFWLGVWQGLIAPVALVASIFRHDLNIYEVHNNGGWYNAGYLMGLACLFGSGRKGTARRRLSGKAREGAMR
jgi:hypothetical protein